MVRVLSPPIIKFYTLTIQTMDKEMKDRLLSRYSDMKTRCCNPNSKSYNSYWWRWIKVEWANWLEFIRDMWNSFIEHVGIYWIENTTLDRIDVNWNYCKENCRWVTWEEQRWQNKTTLKSVKYKWKVYPSIKSLAEEKWLDHRLVWERLQRWRSVEKAVDTKAKDVSWTKILWGWIEYKSIRELERKLWLPKSRISWRLLHWFSLDDAINMPPQSLHSKK